FARAEGIDRIAWAFDPLQAGNAHFNLARLGATAGRYVENMYGERTDALNAGVPTDRLIAEWETTAETPATVPAAAVGTVPRLIATDAGQGGTEESGRTPAPLAVEPAFESPRVLLEIPDEIARLRRHRPEAAERWRVAVRQAFQTAF